MNPLHPITITGIIIALLAIIVFIAIGYMIIKAQAANGYHKRNKTFKEFQFFFASVFLVVFVFLIHNTYAIYAHSYKIVFTILAYTATRTAIRYYKDYPVFAAKIYDLESIENVEKQILNLPLSQETKLEIADRIAAIKN